MRNTNCILFSTSCSFNKYLLSGLLGNSKEKERGMAGELKERFLENEVIRVELKGWLLAGRVVAVRRAGCVVN